MSNGRKISIGCLGALATYFLLGTIMLSIFGALDLAPRAAAFFHALFSPIDWTGPWGSFLFLAAFLAVAGRSRSKAKMAARIGLAFALFVPLALVLMGVAFTGELALGAADMGVAAVMLVVAGVLASYGFSRDSTGYSGSTFEP